MMRIALLVLTLGCIPMLALAEPPASAPANGSRIVLKTRDVKMSRDEIVIYGIFPGTKKVEFNKAADLSVDGQLHTIYIPKSDHYTTRNSSNDESSLRNKSTCVCVDADSNGKFSEDERWFTSLPIRLGDRNFRVEKISAAATQIELTSLEGPVTGLVVGRKVPPFRLTTADGKVVTQDDYKGKAFLLDIWSVT